jgi:transcriptional regulator with XRE-family HTH domain
MTTMRRKSLTFGQRLKREIENRELTQEKFASLVGVSRVTVAVWCNDRFEPLGINVARIARALNVGRDEVERWLAA